jgi:DNA-binding NtrC family response regulator
LRGRILIVEDEQEIREGLLEVFQSEGYETTGAETLANARRELSQAFFDLVLLDLRLPDGSGLDLLADLRGPDAPPVIVVTAFPEVQTAIRALKLGAYDYVNKPFDLDEILLSVTRALETRELREEVTSFRQGQKQRLRHSLDRIVGDSPALAKLRHEIDLVASSDATTALILGESGVGKELVAEAIHYRSDRCDGPMVKLNCAAIPATLLESELFGHEKGAFTDARTTQKGMFELAQRGTFFLDEIAELDVRLQAKLLRVLEDRTITRVGGQRPIVVDVRIVAATNRDLQERIKTGEFREDLYYRLNVFPFVIPPLRERTEDILPLTELFLREFLARAPGKSCRLTEVAKRKLLSYHWPGNARELRNVMERTVLLHQGGEITATDFILGAGRVVGFTDSGSITTLSEVEREHILRVYRQSGSNKTQTADLLGINRLTLRRKLKEFGIE